MSSSDQVIKNDDALTEAIQELSAKGDVVVSREAHAAVLDARALIRTAEADAVAIRERAKDAGREQGLREAKLRSEQPDFGGATATPGAPSLSAPPLQIVGRVRSVTSLVVDASVKGARIGDLVLIEGAGAPLHAEVVGVSERSVTLLPLGDTHGVGTDARVRRCSEQLSVRAGPHLIGRVLDGLGHPIDDLPAFEPGTGTAWPIMRSAPHPIHRKRITDRLPIGVRAIDALATIGCGQRIGVFAGSGVGKSLLLGQIARNAKVDVVVIGLVGERGREVRGFLEDALGETARKRSIVVVATSDEPPMVRLKSAYTATAIAEWFREKGQTVLLLMDSLTRFARAQRDAGLAIGELPARHGFPASVFTALPSLLERAGNSQRGSMTAIYTVLVAGGDLNEPISDEARGLLDGHVVLSRQLAERAHWPAIDVLSSLSRSMPKLASKAHRSAAERLRQILATYESKRDLIALGAYSYGSDGDVDEAIELIGTIEAFLQQGLDERALFDESVELLMKLTS